MIVSMSLILSILHIMKDLPPAHGMFAAQITYRSAKWYLSDGIQSCNLNNPVLQLK